MVDARWILATLAIHERDQSSSRLTAEAILEPTFEMASPTFVTTPSAPCSAEITAFLALFTTAFALVLTEVALVLTALTFDFAVFTAPASFFLVVFVAVFVAAFALVAPRFTVATTFLEALVAVFLAVLVFAMHPSCNSGRDR